jgi:hypothetical protein
VGFPFLAQSAWGDVKVRRGTDEIPIGNAQNTYVEHTAWGYDQGYFSVNAASGMLQPWNAYWIQNLNAENVDILIPPPTGSAAQTETTLAEQHVEAANQPPIGLAFSLRERFRAYHDRTLFLGLAADASEGPDPMDCLAPPPLSRQAPRIAVPHPNWKARAGLYAVDIRHLGSYPAQFNLTMAVPKREKAAKYVLSWKGLGSIPATLKATLFDRGNGRSVNMRRASEHTITVPANHTSHRLRVVFQ